MTEKEIPQKFYVYNGKEVVMTGRKAEKKLVSGKVKTVYEIKPRGSNIDYNNQWVSMKDLFEITDNLP